MNMDDLTRTSGEWLRGAGPESDIVMCSRIRLARNLNDFPFINRASRSEKAEIEAHEGSPWSWSFWRAVLDLPSGEHELCVRAWDAAGQTQPAQPDDTWNFKGYLSAAWHRVRVTVE